MNLSKLSKNQKIMLGAAAVVLVYLIYRWQMGTGSSVTGSSNTGATTGTTGSTDPTQTDQSAADYAALAGQEQSDVAALQQQNEQLQAQLDSFTGGYGGTLDSTGTLSAGGGGGGITGGGGTIASSSPVGGPAQQQVPAMGTGSQPVNRTRPHTVTVGANSPFGRYYRQVTGHNPPARVQVSNWIYRAFTAGIRAATISQVQHPTTSSTRIAHPNPGHRQQSNVSHRLPRSRPKPAGRRPQPAGRRK